MNSNSRVLDILVIGAGAIGCLVGSKLAETGQRVTLVGRPRFVEAVEQNGLFLISHGISKRVENIQALGSVGHAFDNHTSGNHISGNQTSDNQTSEKKRGYDLVILTVKSYDTEEAMTELAAGIARSGNPAPFVLSLQNGVGNEEAIASVLGGERVIAGTITAPVEVPSPGQIVLTKPTFSVGLAAWPAESADSARPESYRQDLIQRLGEVFTTAGVNLTQYDDARAMKWSKLLMNQIGNATSAILSAPPAQIFNHKAMADVEIDALRETLAVMKAAGIPVINVGKYPLGTAAPLLRHGPKWLLRLVLGRIVGGARGGKMPSLFLDLEKGRKKNEIDWYNGAVVRHAQEVDVPVPINTFLTQTVKQLIAHPEERPLWIAAFDRLAEAVKEQPY